MKIIESKAHNQPKKVYICDLPFFKQAISFFMALSSIIKYIYSAGSDEVIRRGKKIFLGDGVKLIKKDEFKNQLIFKVRNDQFYNQYTVTISKYQDMSTIQARCACPYNMGEICRHEAAALFQLNEMIVNQTLDNTQAHFDQSHTVIRMKSIDLKSLRLFTSSRLFDDAENLVKSNKAKISYSENEKVEAHFDVDAEKFDVKLKRNDDKSFDTSCNCLETRHPLCKHKTALFLQLLNVHGEFYFDTIRNWENQKNKLLGLYGYSLNDDLTGKFDFYYQDSKPFLKVLDTTIKKVNSTPVFEKPLVVEKLQAIETSDFTKRLGIVINHQESDYPFFAIDLIEGESSVNEPHTFLGQVNKVDLTKFVQPEKYPAQDRDIIGHARRLQKPEIAKYIAKNSPFGDIWDSIVHSSSEWTQESKDLLYEYALPKLIKLLSSLGVQNALYYLPKGKPYKTVSLQMLEYIQDPIHPCVNVKKVKKDVQVHIVLKQDGTEFPIHKNELSNNLLFMFEGKLYLPQKAADASMLSTLEANTKIDADSWDSFLVKKLLPLSKLYDIKFDKGLVEYKSSFVPKRIVQLSEQGSYFHIKPVFDYDGSIAEWNHETTISSVEEGKVSIIQRNKEEEKLFVDLLQTLHPHLRKPEFEPHFAIHSKYALQKNWFFVFFDKMKEENIELFGYEQLRNFKIHKSKPSTKVQVASNIDWFDTTIEINFDGQVAQLADIQKALAIKQNYVALGDGTYGLLPEEWLQKFSLLFKMAEADGKKLRVSKFNFSVIDELHDMIDDEQVRAELLEKKEMLLNENPEKYTNTEIPPQLQAELRPYQVAGFQWLAYLEHVKWGGLLADDMGLGKTIQTLTFLQHYKNKYGDLKAIVVCPTTLIYNWENEINKFTPELTYIVHHGPNRTNKAENLKEFNIIISTYGTLRSDVEMFMKNTVDYFVLDESQTIKNPSSKVAKAAQLLPAKNRIALSGTPMQNNTFDIYSQMNFLNPGMLGNKEFFKEQFAKPVDKMQDPETKQHLRKLIYPFLLRRTKEQVAKDLPEKTEVTLFCEMGKKQRAIYDMYKNMYRSQILGTIDTQGIQKSQFAILQGLMKLRQICDSPAILKEEVKLANESVKLDELVRELEENMGDHKALVFSQFLGMLALIKEKLKEHNIPYQYFDGSFTAEQREKAIRDFQDNAECRVFLISLKAGGMGLNLTAADYVYLVDPWWNPAVEQQAIDRTHRIGQTKNIFAYRLICKDTVEEKIMTLKEKKNLLVKDIVSDDTNMIKQLTKEDVNYLFS
jgi:SNF2 family DNA or RNA helicase